jgi:Dihydro-orotase-like
MTRKFLQIIILSAFSVAVHGQSLQLWTWDSYKMKFKAPDNMIVSKSNATVYEASNNSITMDIYPKTGQNLTYDGLKKAIINWADQSSLAYKTYNSSGDKQPIYLDNINGYWGCAIDGTKDGFSTSVVLLVNPDYPDINFYVWISYAPEYYHDAIAILKSFTPM